MGSSSDSGQEVGVPDLMQALGLEVEPPPAPRLPRLSGPCRAGREGWGCPRPGGAVGDRPKLATLLRCEFASQSEKRQLSPGWGKGFRPQRLAFQMSNSQGAGVIRWKEVFLQ